jgi:hypothetical protein
VTHARLWTDAHGRRIEAEAVEVTDTRVRLRYAGGKETWVDIATLSGKDREYLTSLDAQGRPKSETEKPAAEAKRILFIGNSYTKGIKNAVKDIIALSPYADSTLEFIHPGGRNLKQHAGNPETLDAVRTGSWDYVVLQDQSQTPAVFPDRFREGLSELDELIDEIGAQTVLFMTWGYRDGDRKYNPERFPSYRPMQDELSRAYERGAEMADATLSPVGEAWRIVFKEDEALWKTLYKKDGSHPSPKGAYLAAHVFYWILFEEDPAALGFTFNLTEEECRILQMAAKQSVGQEG